MPLDARDKITLDSLKDRFTYHPPNPLQAEKYKALRAAAFHFAEVIVQECPSSSERSTAITHVDAAVMFANAAIARQQPADGGEKEPGVE